MVLRRSLAHRIFFLSVHLGVLPPPPNKKKAGYATDNSNNNVYTLITWDSGKTKIHVFERSLASLARAYLKLSLMYLKRLCLANATWVFGRIHFECMGVYTKMILEVQDINLF